MLAMAALIAGASPVMAGLETEVEEGIGQWIAQAFIAQRGRLDQPPIDEWITGLGRDLLEHSPRRGFDYRFIVLDSPESNGFALPGGWVFVTAGLLESMHSEDELAAVIAHELGHLANRDFQRVALRTALWLGLAQVLRNNDRDDWVPLVQGAQLVETLHHSREREGEADATGARIAWDAGYDPRAMAAFLGDEPKWSYLQTVFSTHPHPNRRCNWLDRRFAQFLTEDPEGALRLARSLIGRGRCETAAQVLHEPMPPPHEHERAALLELIDGRRAPARPGDGVGLTPERVSGTAAVVSSMAQAHAGAQEPRDLAWRRLRRLWRDEQIERALILAQAVDPELNEPGYLLLVAQSVNLLHRALRGANLTARTLDMRASTLEGLRALGSRVTAARVEGDRLCALSALADDLSAEAEALAERGPAETRELARIAAKYHECARLAAPVLSELALAGEGDPAGRLVFSRFLLIEAQVKLLEDRLARLESAGDLIAGQAWDDAVQSYRLRLNLAALEADKHTRALILETLARRAGTDAESLQAAWAEGTMPADRALEMLSERMRPRDGPFGDDLRATQIIMRIAFVDVKEQVESFAKGKPATEGAD